jgi:hypothetical protein
LVATRLLRAKTQLIGLAAVDALVVAVVLKPVPDSRWISDNGFRPLQDIPEARLIEANDQATVYLRSKVSASNWDCLVVQERISIAWTDLGRQTSRFDRVSEENSHAREGRQDRFYREAASDTV